MRYSALIPAVVLIGAFVVMVAVDASLPAPGLAVPVSAQAETEPAGLPTGFDVSHVPFLEAWRASPHADVTSVAFTYWSANDPPVVPVACAKCHSGDGFHDFLGLDGSEPGAVSEPADPSVITCVTCHNEVTVAQGAVLMPSGVVLTGLGREAVCMECHQGRQSGVSVAAAIERAGVDHDEVMEAQAFLNIHYHAAAATRYGSDAHGGFEYPGRRYEPFFEHAQGYSTCQSCHDPHSLELDLVSCATCHAGVETVADVRDIRMPGSFVDFDGDGDVTKGIYHEIANLRALLFELIQAYAAEVIGTPIGYFDAHPYFFQDVDGDGEISAAEAVRDNAFTSFTPRLLAAAYNYQVTKKDPGAYVHNPKYTIQLIYDSIEDLAGALGAQELAAAVARPGAEPSATLAAVDANTAALLARAARPSSPIRVGDMRQLRDFVRTADLDLEVIAHLRRDDAPHFDGTQQSWRYWDEAGVVPAACATCHTATGMPFLLAHGVQIAHAPTQGMACRTCHTDEAAFGLYEVSSVTFPSGAELSFGTSADNMCAVCHQGRASTDAVDQRIGAIPDDTVSDALGFINIHYFSSAATRFGGEARGGYQYADREYVGYFVHDMDVTTCTQCHDPHNQRIDVVALCSDCHAGVATVEDLRDIREFFGDFDGDGDTSKGTYYEIANLTAMLYGAIQAYARDTVGTPIVYSGLAHPYFFTDLDASGIARPDEVNFANRYLAWTPRLLRAAYNYQYARKDPGSYAHNSQYVIQLLHDSLDDLGVDVSNLERPDPDMF
jgi:hypothetical protein